MLGLVNMAFVCISGYLMQFSLPIELQFTPIICGVGDHYFSVQILICRSIYLKNYLGGELIPHLTTTLMRSGVLAKCGFVCTSGLLRQNQSK